MLRRSFVVTGLTLGLVVFLLLSVTTAAQQPAPAAAPQPEDWLGIWQMGPSVPAETFGCGSGDGIARFFSVYYEPLNRVYFMGGRCETDTVTVGTVFYFDPATQTYHATGATLSVPVSNYNIAVIENDGQGHGPGLYIVGGRTITGGQTNAVQVYYPDDNLATTIATDPFPPATPYSPGAVVAADGQIYVFGGFSGTSMTTDMYIYNPAAAAGSRWTLSSCPLPTARSYIATAVIGDLIYAMGGDEWDGSGLVPIDDTIVLDVANLAACWQDGAMADMPAANGDAPAVYVPDTDAFLGGGIYVVGGYWPTPGPYRTVYRYDIATDVWESFPELAVPAPATGRRNQAATYVPAAGDKGLGNGVPGIWTFGGYDGSGTNAMTDSSEFFSIDSGAVLVLPEALSVSGEVGADVVHHMWALNNYAATETYDLSYTSDVGWPVTLPSTVGPVLSGEAVTFDLGVHIPDTVVCPATGTFSVTATSQSVVGNTDTQAVFVEAMCTPGSVTGVVSDANTGLPLADAYVWLQDSPDGLGAYYDAFTDASGEYLMDAIPPGTYYFGVDRRYYQPSFYPAGWPAGAIMLQIGGGPDVVDVALVGSEMEWAPDTFSVTLEAGGLATRTLALNNIGTGPLAFNLSELPPTVIPPEPEPMGQPAPARLDPQLVTDLAAAPDGQADMLVVLPTQANLDAAYGIADWNARGQFVLNALRSHAEASQRDLRAFLAQSGTDYQPLYVTNAIIVRGGSLALAESLAARSDVAYVQANHRIAIDDPIEPVADSPTAPDAVEWNITKVKADAVWALGYSGEGTVVAEIDTGTQYDHPALVDKYRGNLGGGNFDHNYNWFDPYAQCPSGGTVPCDGAQHGTHVMGTMVGDDGVGNQIGMAPGAKWISCKGGDSASGYLLTNELLQCAEWILAPFDQTGANPDPAMRPHVVNNSWGGGPNDYWYSPAIAAWRAAGIFPAFATGNPGSMCSGAHSPGDNWNSFGVGATDVNDNIASFSGRGPAQYTGILKPQITAPGVNIRSSIPGGIYQGGWQGTSMATPHVAGAIALLWSADPELVGQIDTSAWLLERTAMPKTSTQGCGGDLPTDVPNNVYGWGRLDIYAAVEAALGEVDDLSWLDVTPASGTIAAGDTLSIELAFAAPTTAGVYTGTLWLVANDPYNHDVRIPVRLNVTEQEIGYSVYLPLVFRNYP